MLAPLARVPDPRSPHSPRFPLTVLLAACAALLGGARSIERLVKCGGKERRETAYGITSADPEGVGGGRTAGLGSGRDAGEDASRIQTGAALQMMAALRNAAGSLLGTGNIAEALRANPYRVPDGLAELGVVKL